MCGEGLRTEYLHDALIWAELAMAAFVGFFIFVILALVVGPWLLVGWKAIWIPPILLSSVPLILATLTYVKIMQPLKANSVPSRKWASILEVLGYVFGLFFGGILLWIANKKITLAQDQDTSWLFPLLRFWKGWIHGRDFAFGFVYSVSTSYSELE